MEQISDTRGRKDKATAGVFARPFGTNEAIDIVADIYHGVSYSYRVDLTRSTRDPH